MSTTEPPAKIPDGGSKRLCSMVDCPNPHKARGLCDLHYKRWQRSVSPKRGSLEQLLPPLETDEGDGELRDLLRAGNVVAKREAPPTPEEMEQGLDGLWANWERATGRSRSEVEKRGEERGEETRSDDIMISKELRE